MQKSVVCIFCICICTHHFSDVGPVLSLGQGASVDPSPARGPGLPLSPAPLLAAALGKLPGGCCGIAFQVRRPPGSGWESDKLIHQRSPPQVHIMHHDFACWCNYLHKVHVLHMFCIFFCIFCTYLVWPFPYFFASCAYFWHVVDIFYIYSAFLLHIFCLLLLVLAFNHFKAFQFSIILKNVKCRFIWLANSNSFDER